MDEHDDITAALDSDAPPEQRVLSGNYQKQLDRAARAFDDFIAASGGTLTLAGGAVGSFDQFVKSGLKLDQATIHDLITFFASGGAKAASKAKPPAVRTVRTFWRHFCAEAGTSVSLGDMETGKKFIDELVKQRELAAPAPAPAPAPVTSSSSSSTTLRRIDSQLFADVLWGAIHHDWEATVVERFAHAAFMAIQMFAGAQPLELIKAAASSNYAGLRTTNLCFRTINTGGTRHRLVVDLQAYFGGRDYRNGITLDEGPTIMTSPSLLLTLLMCLRGLVSAADVRNVLARARPASPRAEVPLVINPDVAEHIFVDSTGAPMTKSSMNAVLREVCAALDTRTIDVDNYPLHKAQNMVDMGCPPDLISSMFGSNVARKVKVNHDAPLFMTNFMFGEPSRAASDLAPPPSLQQTKPKEPEKFGPPTFLEDQLGQIEALFMSPVSRFPVALDWVEAFASGGDTHDAFNAENEREKQALALLIAGAYGSTSGIKRKSTEPATASDTPAPKAARVDAYGSASGAPAAVGTPGEASTPSTLVQDQVETKPPLTPAKQVGASMFASVTTEVKPEVKPKVKPEVNKEISAPVGSTTRSRQKAKKAPSAIAAAKEVKDEVKDEVKEERA